MKSIINHNQRAHDIIYKFYNLKHDEIFNDYEQKRIRLLLRKIIKKTSNNKINVLDYGAGTGNLSLKFLELGCYVTALDISKNELNFLKKLSGNNRKLKTKIFKGGKIPFPNNSFDIVASYSVLHHIPNYLEAIREMVRVVKKDGLVVLEHEANENKWDNDLILTEYKSLTKKTLLSHLGKLYKTRELFLLDFWKSLFITLFIDKRHKREGDIHVWPDDHIDWVKIKKIMNNSGKIIRNKDYLMYAPRGGYLLYKKYKDRTSDTKSLIFKKTISE